MCAECAVCAHIRVLCKHACFCVYVRACVRCVCAAVHCVFVCACRCALSACMCVCARVIFTPRNAYGWHLQSNLALPRGLFSPPLLRSRLLGARRELSTECLGRTPRRVGTGGPQGTRQAGEGEWDASAWICALQPLQKPKGLVLSIWGFCCGSKFHPSRNSCKCRHLVAHWRHCRKPRGRRSFSARGRMGEQPPAFAEAGRWRGEGRKADQPPPSVPGCPAGGPVPRGPSGHPVRDHHTLQPLSTFSHRSVAAPPWGGGRETPGLTRWDTADTGWPPCGRQSWPRGLSDFLPGSRPQGCPWTELLPCPCGLCPTTVRIKRVGRPGQ